MQIKGEIHKALIRSANANKKMFALLIDPDKADTDSLMERIDHAVTAEVDFLFVGGSLMSSDNLKKTIETIKTNCTIPVILFPGSALQIDNGADAILFLSLISGRNPEMLIGNQIIAAPYLKRTDLDVLSTGYMLIDSGKSTTASYISNSMPIPADKSDIAACTAMAGEMLGLSMIYLDAGSGALYPVPGEMIAEVRKSVDIPLIVGGGIDHIDKAKSAYEAGADIIVIGNAIERNPQLIQEIAAIRNSFVSSSISK